MRRLVAFTVLAFGLAVPAVGFALDQVEDGTLSVRNGVGKVFLQVNGSTVGRVAHGKVTVTDPIPSDEDDVDFWNCDKRSYPSDATTVCWGNNIRFRAIGGRYRIWARGTGIYLSAVGHGGGQLDGRGDEPDVDRDGAYSLNDEPYRSLPDEPQPFALAAPSRD
jgi:hypothetical protein